MLEDAQAHYRMVCQNFDNATDRTERRLIDKERNDR